jgi:RNA-directed DNA polymerase
MPRWKIPSMRPGCLFHLVLDAVLPESKEPVYIVGGNLKRVTSKKKMRVKLKAVKAEMRARRHLPIPEQGVWLASVLAGHYRYYAVPDNSEALRAFRHAVKRLWFHSLRRRSQRHRLSGRRITALETRWLPQPRILHPWPTDRFDARTLNRSPVR